MPKPITSDEIITLLEELRDEIGYLIGHDAPMLEKLSVMLDRYEEVAEEE